MNSAIENLSGKQNNRYRRELQQRPKEKRTRRFRLAASTIKLYIFSEACKVSGAVNDLAAYL